MANRNYYEILGINQDADEDTIKKAYRNLALKFHPDRNPGDAKALEHMKEINEAYAVLSDAQKRQLYDADGRNGLEGYSQEDIFRGVDFASLFHEFGLGDIFGSGEGLFSDLFGGRASMRPGTTKGADLRYDLHVTLEEVASGVEKTVPVTRSELCPMCKGAGAKPSGLTTCDQCHGTGQIIKETRAGYSIFRQIQVCGRCQGRGKIIKEPCNECGGKGTIEKAGMIKVKIPPGTDTGHGIRIEGAGEKGGGLPGDLYVVVNVEKHPIFERHGDDIYVQRDITFATAALGSKVNVPGLYHETILDIPEGTQTGSVFRIDGKGLPHLGGRGQGDEYVVVKVAVPTNLRNNEKELLKEFAGLGRKPDIPTKNKVDNRSNVFSLIKRLFSKRTG